MNDFRNARKGYSCSVGDAFELLGMALGPAIPKKIRCFQQKTC